MPITPQHMKEQFSMAYCRAVAACAGLNFGQDVLDYGVDGFFSIVKNRGEHHRRTSGFRLDFQAKSTATYIDNGNEILYDLDIEAYRDLIDTEVGCERILIVFILPENPNERMTINDNDIIMRHAAYWCSLRGQPDTTNSSSIRITIPKQQKITVEELHRLLDCVYRGVPV